MLSLHIHLYVSSIIGMNCVLSSTQIRSRQLLQDAALNNEIYNDACQ